MEITAASAEVTEQLCTMTRTRAFGEACALASQGRRDERLAEIARLRYEAVALSPDEGRVPRQNTSGRTFRRNALIVSVSPSTPMLEP